MTAPSRSAYHTVVIGSGIAGLFIALEARKLGPVLVVTKGAIKDSNTGWAQGGIAAAIGPRDDPASHLRDTIEAGAGLVDEEAARVLCSEAPARVRDLIMNGVEFDLHDGEISLGMEAAHSAARILHAGGDRTGAEIEAALATRIDQHEVEVVEYSVATSLQLSHGRVSGIELLDTEAGVRRTVAADVVALASGGAGQLFSHTTNPQVATGDGVGLAFMAGAEVADVEFFQFHPTALRMPGVRPFLISEAVRGEGAVLRNRHGEAFMPRYHTLKDLAPRDVVARAIVSEMRATNTDHVFLDCTALDDVNLPQRFPAIYAFCLGRGVDITSDYIPVAPAAHYFMGGVRTDLWGRTTLPGLYACGEVACTGVHGANRLASNSLMETLVFGKRVAAHIGHGEGGFAAPSANAQSLEMDFRSAPSRAALQSLMWDGAGIERTGDELEHALEMTRGWEDRAGERLPDFEDRQMSILARLMLTAALQRTESRGGHYRHDYPERNDIQWQRRQVFRYDH